MEFFGRGRALTGLLGLLFLCAAGNLFAAPTPKTVAHKAEFTVSDEDLQKEAVADHQKSASTVVISTSVLGIKFEMVQEPEPQPEPDYPEVPAAPVIAELPEPPKEQNVDCAKEKCVALTFDDGPSHLHTPQLLDILAKEEVPVTFFVLGNRVEAWPEIIARAVEDGHEIASHTWRHANLTTMSADARKKDLAKANKAIEKITGQTPHLLRPPYGASNSEVSKSAKKAGLTEVFWDIDTQDWKDRDAKVVTKRAAGAKDGSIVLLHDIHDTTIEAAPKIIKKLRKEGFTFVTVSELLGEVKPGESYSRAR